MTYALLTVFVPLVGAFLIPFVPRKFKAGFSVLILGVTFAYSLRIIPAVVKFKELSLTNNLTAWFGFSFMADGLSVFMAVVSVLVALLIAVYSIDYMRHYANRGEFYFWMVLFVGGMMGLVFSAHLMLTFCFWELTSVCSWRLIGFYRKEKDTKAADKAFLITFFGASLMLIGLVLVYLQFGTLDITQLRGKVLADTAAFLILAGVISKSAQLPLQTWLPDAGVAPTPVTALLHAAVLVKIGIYVFARVFGMTFAASPLFLNAVVVLSVSTIIVAAGCALVENNIKRVLAYSTISQLGYILLALSLNSTVAFHVALIYILAHSLAKAGLFLCAGIVEHETGTKEMSELGGLAKTMPLTAAAFLLCAFSIIGIPPFLGFWPKFLVVLLSLKAGYIWAGSLAVAGALFTLLYLMRFYTNVFLGEPRGAQAREKKDSLMVAVVVFLGVVSLLLGFIVKIPFDFLSRTIR